MVLLQKTVRTVENHRGMPAENANCNPGHHPRTTVTLQRMATHRRWHEIRPRLLMLIFQSIMNVCSRLLQLFLHLMASRSLSLISLQTSCSHCSGATTANQDPLKTCLQMPVWRNDQRQFAEQWCVNSGEDTDVLRQRFHHRRCCCCCCCWVYLWSQGGLFPPTRLSWHFESPASRHFVPTLTGAVLNKTPGSIHSSFDCEIWGQGACLGQAFLSIYRQPLQWGWWWRNMWKEESLPSVRCNTCSLLITYSTTESDAPVIPIDFNGWLVGWMRRCKCAITDGLCRHQPESCLWIRNGSRTCEASPRQMLHWMLFK